MRAFILGPALALLAGCATSPDPSQGGFISGVNGLLSGGYDQRVQVQSGELNRMRTEQQDAEAEANRSRSALAGRERRLHDLSVQVAMLDKSLKESRAEAARQRARSAELSDADRRLRDDLENVNTRLESLRSKLASDRAGTDYDAERQQYLNLQATIEALHDQLKEGL